MSAPDAAGAGEGFGVFGSYATIEDDSFLSKAHSLLPGGGAMNRKKRGRAQDNSAASSDSSSRKLRRPPPKRGLDVTVSLEYPSPYGVKPEGCAWMDSLNDGTLRPARNASGMGPWAGLSDDLMLYVLGFMDGSELATLSTASRGLYAFAHHTDLWRSLTLGRFKGDFRYANDWKSTWVNATLAAAGRPPSTPYVHRPLAVKGFYSDLLFKHHSCAAAEIPTEWHARHNTIPRVSARELTVGQFVERYEKPNIPVIITDVVTQWPGFGKWIPGFLAARHGQAKFHCGGYTMTLADYFAYCEGVSGRDDRPLYLFERNWLQAAPEMGAEFSPPEYFADDLSALLAPPFSAEDDRPDHRWMIAGPRKSGSTFHKDPNASSAWNATVHGDKA